MALLYVLYGAGEMRAGLSYLAESRPEVCALNHTSGGLGGREGGRG